MKAANVERLDTGELVEISFPRAKLASALGKGNVAASLQAQAAACLLARRHKAELDPWVEF